MKATATATATATNEVEAGVRTVELRVAQFKLRTLPNGNIELHVPTHLGPMFSQDYIAHLRVFMSDRDIETAFDDAAELLLKRQLAAMLF